MAALHSSLRRRSPHDAASARPRSTSPPVVHPNVSYTRGASSTSRSAPRYRRGGMPRAAVRTPTDLDSYPSDNHSTSPFSHSAQEEYLQRPAVECNDSVRTVPRTPTGASTGRAVVVESPSYLQSYPSDDESTASPPADSILSPLSSPRFLTPEASSSPRRSRRSSVASSVSTSRHQHSPRARSTSSRNPHLHQEVSFQPNVYFVSPFPGDHSQCQHTCPHCRVVSVYSSGQTTPVLFSQPMHVHNVTHDPVHDPRSPIGRTNTIPSHPEFVFRPLCSCLPGNDVVTVAPHHLGDRHPG